MVPPRQSAPKGVRLLSLLALMTSALVILGACTTSSPATGSSGTARTAPAQASPSVDAPADQATQPPGASGLASSSDGHLVIWATGDEITAKSIQAAGDIFTKQNPKVSVQVQPVPWNEAHAKILASAAAGVGPDIMIGGMSWGIEFGKLGGMVNLGAKYPELVTEVDKLTLPQIRASIIPPSGEVYALQHSVDLLAMFYRSDLVGRAPESWDELTKTITKVRGMGKKGFGMDWGNTDWVGYYMFLYSAGGSFYDSGCTQATLNSPEGVAALEFYRDLYTKYGTSTDPHVDVEGGLVTGEYPIGFAGSWSAASMEFRHPEMMGQWGMATTPKGPGGKNMAFLGGQVIGIMAGSKNQDTAAQFIRFLYTPDAVEAVSLYRQSQLSYYIPPGPALLPAAKLPTRLEHAFKEVLSAAGGPPNCPGWEESTNEINKLLQEVIFNKADPKQALDQAANIMNQNLNN